LSDGLCVERVGQGEVVVNKGLEKACMTLLETTKTTKEKIN
jgi:hypothetical protein